MVNFMCLCDWVTEWLDIWLNILGVSLRVFLNEFNIQIGRLSKVEGSPQYR
jgi:hypothetical protein